MLTGVEKDDSSDFVFITDNAVMADYEHELNFYRGLLPKSLSGITIYLYDKFNAILEVNPYVYRFSLSGGVLRFYPLNTRVEMRQAKCPAANDTLVNRYDPISESWVDDCYETYAFCSQKFGNVVGVLTITLALEQVQDFVGGGVATSQLQPTDFINFLVSEDKIRVWDGVGDPPSRIWGKNRRVVPSIRQQQQQQ